MESPIHTLKNLFEQPGLPQTNRDIENFIEQHKPVSTTKAIYELDCFYPVTAELSKRSN